MKKLIINLPFRFILSVKLYKKAKPKRRAIVTYKIIHDARNNLQTSFLN